MFVCPNCEEEISRKDQNGRNLKHEVWRCDCGSLMYERFNLYSRWNFSSVQSEGRFYIEAISGSSEMSVTVFFRDKFTNVTELKAGKSAHRLAETVLGLAVVERLMKT